MDETNPYYKTIVEDPRYANGPSKDEFPMFESLKLLVFKLYSYLCFIAVSKSNYIRQI